MSLSTSTEPPADAGIAPFTGAERLADAVLDAGIDTVFGLPGVQNLAAWPALEDRGVRVVGVRHEQAAGYAADGFARATGTCGIALTTTGPGAANIVAATGEAWASGIPLVVVATDIPASMRIPGSYRGVLHECTSQASLFSAVTKAQFLITDPTRIYDVMRRAIDTSMQAPPRPVYVEVPSDFLRQPAGSAADEQGGIAGGADPALDLIALRAAAELLAGAQRPLVWAGGGVAAAGAEAALCAIAVRLGAPVLSTYAGRGVGVAAGELDIQLAPHFSQVGLIWDEADVVLAAGSGFDGMMTQNWAMPAPPALVMVNADLAQPAVNYPPTVAIEADAGATLSVLGDLLGTGRNSPWAPTASQLRADVRAQVEAENPRELAFVDAVAAGLPAGSPLFLDLCIGGYWLAGLQAAAGSRQLAYPMGWGTLGYAFQAALGAAAVPGQRPVVVAGDGGLLFGIAELATAVQERLPVTVVVVDDAAYGMLRYDQIHLGDRPAGVDLLSPNFVAVAEGFGLRAREAGVNELASAISAGVNSGRPNMIVVRERFDPPPTVSVRWYRRSS